MAMSAIILTVLSNSFEEFKQQAAAAAQFSDYIQIDVMDGKFVPKTSFPERNELDLDLKPGKVKKPIEIDEPEPAVAVDEKVEEDPLAVATEEDDSADEISLDGEEVNPFGDRWEE
jgi:hypothetical protein